MIIIKKRLFKGTVPAYVKVFHRYYTNIIGKWIFIVTEFSHVLNLDL